MVRMLCAGQIRNGSDGPPPLGGDDGGIDTASSERLNTPWLSPIAGGGAWARHSNRLALEKSYQP